MRPTGGKYRSKEATRGIGANIAICYVRAAGGVGRNVNVDIVALCSGGVGYMGYW